MQDITFAKAQSLLEPGDIILFEPGIMPSSQLIVYVGGSPYSHAAMVARWGRDWMVLEILQFYGGRIVTLESQVQGWPGQWVVVRPHQPYLQAPAVEAMRKFAGCRYGWGSVFLAGFQYTKFLRRLLPAPPEDGAINGTAPFCSQAVSSACRSGGKRDPVVDKLDSVTEPGHFADPSFGEVKYRLWWDETPGEMG